MLHDAQYDAELAYMSDYVIAILNSPTWVSPISKFVDDNCGIFEDVEENKLEYTPLHSAFRQLIDDLLVAHLLEMSISTEQFMRFCERGLSGNNELHRNLVEQLVSCEDFLVFKAMMVKRNAELNREVVCATCPEALMPQSDGGICQQLAQVQCPIACVTNEAADEAERIEAERICAEAELKLAEALSLQIERRMQLMKALDEVLEVVSQIYKARADALEQQMVEEARARELEQVHSRKPPAVLAPVVPAAQHPFAGEIISATVAIRPLSQAPLAQVQHAENDGCMNPNEILALERKRAVAAAEKERAERVSATKRQELMRVAAEGPSYDDAPTYHPQHGLVVPSAVAMAPSAPPPTITATLQPTAEEKVARSEHLKRQRALLVEKKNQERQSQLTAFQVQNGATHASGVAQEKCATPQNLDSGRLLAKELSGRPHMEPAAPIAANADAAALEMRRMLTRQLKASFR